MALLFSACFFHWRAQFLEKSSEVRAFLTIAHDWRDTGNPRFERTSQRQICAHSRAAKHARTCQNGREAWAGVWSLVCSSIHLAFFDLH
jgi:hypothetical protein